MGFLDKVWRWLGGGDPIEEEIIELPIADHRKMTGQNQRGNLVGLQAPKSIKVVVCEPSTFEEAQGIADNLKNRRQVILNLEHTQGDIARRIIDFVSGVTYALDGQTQQLGEGIILFAPNNVEISKDPRMVLRGSYSYNRGGIIGSDD
jgi:cell division inhibitor SepF